MRRRKDKEDYLNIVVEDGLQRYVVNCIYECAEGGDPKLDAMEVKLWDNMKDVTEEIEQDQRLMKLITDKIYDSIDWEE